MSFEENLENSNSSLVDNRDYEFEAELEDHQLGDQKIYRLYYIDYHRIGENYGRTENNVGVIDWPFEPFMLPEGMSREEGFKVLSYLTDFIEKQLKLKLCSHQSVAILNSVLNLKRLGFKRVNIDTIIKDSDIIDLFTVSGRLLLFKNSSHYQKYFEWYTEGITLDEVKAIYAKYNREFNDLILLDNPDEMQIESSNNNPQLMRKI